MYPRACILIHVHLRLGVLAMVTVHDIAAKRAVVEEQRKHLRGWEAWALEAVRGGPPRPTFGRGCRSLGRRIWRTT